MKLSLIVALALSVSLGCGSSPPLVTAVTQSEITVDGAEQQECVAFGTSRADVDACRAKVRARWCGPDAPLARAGACGDAGVPTIVTVGAPPLTSARVDALLEVAGAGPISPSIPPMPAADAGKE